MNAESTEITTSPNGKPLAPYEQAVVNSEQNFAQMSHGLDFNVERVFAVQMLMKNDYSMKIANSSPRSVRLAMLNLAATGLTLNPANAYAYLVPRDGEIKLDISYKGLIKIATDAGSIRWGKAETVHEGDTFRYRGPATEPVHEADVFAKDRGPIIGVYCIARTIDGDTLVDFMDLAEIHKIRASSTAWTKGSPGRKGPWEDWFGEMVKKSMVKRASKTWPYTDQKGQLAQAIALTNEAEGGYDLSPGRLAGRPTDGIWESLDQDTQIGLQKDAQTVNAHFEADNIAAAVDFIARQKYGADEESGLWTLLDSKVRTALKKEREARRNA